MKTTLKLKNFRIFDQIGTSLDITPITFLTGCNSSGKSSAVKGLFLLESFMAQIKEAFEDGKEIDLSKFKLDFSTYPNSTLGRFEKVINRSCKNENELVTFEYTKHSLYLSKDINVVLTFSRNEHDGLDNGYLHSLELYIDDELFYRTSKDSQTLCDLNVIKTYCADFVLAEIGAHIYSNASIEYNLMGSISKEEYDSLSDISKKMLFKNGPKRAAEVCYHVRHSKQKRILDLKQANENKLNDYINALEQTQKEHSFFIIPVIQDVLAFVSADKFKEVCLSILGDTFSESDNLLLGKITEDFVASNAPNFIEYFKNKEFEFLSNAFITSIFPINKRLNIPTEVDLFPIQDFSLQNPLNYTICTLEYNDSGKSIFKKSTAEERTIREETALKSWHQTPLTFGWLYEFLMSLNHIYSKDKEIDMHYKIGETSYTHYSYYILAHFASNIIIDSLLPEWIGNLSYVGSSRVDVKRLYSLEEKNSFSALLKRYFDGKKNIYDSPHRDINKDYQPNSFINKWIKQFGIGESISLSFDKEGLGVQIRLQKNDTDESQILADEGYGVTQLASVLLEIETAILNSKAIFNNHYYGMKQLPMIKEETLPQAVTIVLEEPEIHLHPKYQSLIAEMLLDAYERFNIHFIIETHSEYLLRRTQYMVACSKYENNEDLKKNCPFKVFYFPEKGTAYDMQYRTNGKFTQSFGEGFFDEADKWAIKMYELEED